MNLALNKDDKIITIKGVTPSDKDYRCLVCGNRLAVHKNHFQHVTNTCLDAGENPIVGYARKFYWSHSDLITRIPELRGDVIFGVYSRGMVKKLWREYTVERFPDLLVITDKKVVPVFLVVRNSLKSPQLDFYRSIRNREVLIIQIQLSGVINSFTLNNTQGIDKSELDKALVSTFRSDLYVTKTRFTQLSHPYGVCSDCDEPLELVINTYEDSAKPIKGIAHVHIRDDKNEDKDLVPRFKLGAALLRCPKCHKVMPVFCPDCLSKGKYSTMKVLTNPKRNHTYICCENYSSYTDRVNCACHIPDNKLCKANLILYSDTEGKVFSEDFKRVGGLFNWLGNYSSVDSKKEEKYI